MDRRHRIPVECFAVSVYVARRDGGRPAWLLMRRREKGRGYGGVWQQVTGGLGPDETPPEAARREVLEETGLDVVELWTADAVETFYERTTRSIWMTPVFLAVVGEGELTLSDEHDAHRWCSTADAMELVPFWQQRESIRRIEEEFFVRTPSRWLRCD